MKVLVCGGRDFADPEKLSKVLDQYKDMTCLIQGGAKGADRLAKKWAELRGIPVITMEANWNYYAKSAGPIRNSWMLDYCEPDYVVMFPGGRGTQDMCEKAEARGLDGDVID